MAFIHTSDGEFKCVQSFSELQSMFESNELTVLDSPEFTYYNFSIYLKNMSTLFLSLTFAIKSFTLGCDIDNVKRDFHISRERSIPYDELITSEYSTQEIFEYISWFNHHYELGDYFYLFEGDKIKAEENYLKAIEIHNHPVAMHDLAYNIYYPSEKYAEAKELLQKSASRGYLYAMLHLGDYYIYQEKDYPKALEWYMKAFKKNEKNAAPYLGNYYANIEKNYDEAIRYYLIDKKYYARFANINLGNVYWKKGNLEKCVYYFLEAANAGFTNGMTRLGNYYQEVLKDYTTAKYWYIKAIEKDNTDAMECMAQFYETIEINPEEAAKYRKMIVDTTNKVLLSI